MTSNDFILTKEQQDLIEDNHNLIFGYCESKGIDVSECYDILAFAICKAAYYYVSSVANFSTFAYKCFDNAIRDERRKQYTKIGKIEKEMLSLDYEISEDGDAICCLSDLITDNFNLEDSVCNKIFLSDIMKCLKENETFVLHELFLEKRTLKDIGNELGLSRQRVAQIKDYAIDKIKRKFKNK